LPRRGNQPHIVVIDFEQPEAKWITPALATAIQLVRGEGMEDSNGMAV
jgi:hypothetical protein